MRVDSCFQEYFSQRLIHCLAIKRVLNLEGTKYIVYDDQVKRTSLGNGYVKMIALIAAGLVDRVLVMKADRLPAKFMPLLTAFFQERNTAIESAEDYGRDMQLLADLAGNVTCRPCRPEAPKNRHTMSLATCRQHVG
jgi:hypothetical protein